MRMMHQGSKRYLYLLFPGRPMLHIFYRCYNIQGAFSLASSSNTVKRLTGRSLAGLALAVGLVTTLVALALSLGIEAVVGVSSLVAQVGVDANELATVLGNDTAHVDLARAVAVALAVTARAIHLAVVLGVEVDDVDGAAAVVLDHLVRGVVGAAADDVGGAVALEGDGVFAHVLEPDVLEVAGTAEKLEDFLWRTWNAKYRTQGSKLPQPGPCQ